MSESCFEIHPDNARVFQRLAEMVALYLAEPQGIRANIPQDDHELAAVWGSSLKTHLKADRKCVLALVSDERFGKESIWLSDEAVEGLLRACAAIRQRIHQSTLSDIPDELLEDAELDIQDLDEEQQCAYSTYLFLAYLQEILIDELSASS